MSFPKVIIIQTTPYDTQYSSRTLDAYFHFWNRDNVRQIFSRNINPQKGHCSELYQITDANLLKRWLRKIKEPGIIYYYKDLDCQGANRASSDGELISKTYKIGRKHTPSIELLREVLWRKKYWCTDKLVSWLDEYQPDLVFYNFSNNLFLQKIVLFIADRYNIPVITAVGDDYYFNDRKSFSLSYLLFRRKFKALTEKVFKRPGSAVYACDKVRDKYNSFFGLNGETIYFNSNMKRKAFMPINQECPSIVYFGNIRLGRNFALVELADALKSVNSNYKLQVFSNEVDDTYTSVLTNHSNIEYCGAISYDRVQEKAFECDIYVVVESFNKEDIAFTEYSLSTKAADGLKSGALVLAYGPIESGVIDYLNKTQAAAVCTDKNTLAKVLSHAISDVQYQEELYNRSNSISEINHTVQGSTKSFINVVSKVIEENMSKLKYSTR